ncbi:MAG: DEAD/DEAH box helicase, partial [Desulfobulbus sp.]
MSRGRDSTRVASNTPKSAATNPRARALYLFPLKALAQDQLKGINRLAALMPGCFSDRSLPAAAVYDGDTSSYHRKKIRDHLPAILLTNPDMLHLSLLPYHHLWGTLFANLTHVVLDEVHTYRGVFGSHMAWVIRRLRRICSVYGSNPVFILSSATIGNPEELGEKLLSEQVSVITESGAPQAKKNFILLNPLDSAPIAATMLLEAALHRKLRTIVYTQSRKLTELITLWSQKRCKENRDKIASYRAGFLPEDRRRIEQKLASGELLAVISTSALELGIDIGGLDICLLVGYPGSIMATHQRGGRVGRSGRESLVVLIGHEDALDQNFMRHPDDFFSRPVEPVALDPENRTIAASHLVCAAAETPIFRDEKIIQSRNIAPLLPELTTTGKLLQSAEGNTWFSARKYPQRKVSLRGTTNTFLLYNVDGRRLLGEIDGYRACRECHEGAVYLHMAKTWLVQRFDETAREILLKAASPPYYTRTLVDKDTEIEETYTTTTCGNATVSFGRLRVTERIHAYQKILIGRQKVIAQIPLDFPPRIFATKGMWLEISPEIQQKIERENIHFMGSIHALEHAMIGMMPLLVLCDRNDIGGISYPLHEQTGRATIFIYDGYAGGVGLCEKGFAATQELLVETEKIVSECGCDLGCPTCVHSPKCGSGNRPIDKNGCIRLLQYLRRTDIPGKMTTTAKLSPVLVPKKDKKISFQLPVNWGVFDLETKYSAAEVGGWHKAEKMGISMGVVYDGGRDMFTAYTEEQVPQLVDHLFNLELVVGFNNKKFDNRVLAAYSRKPLSRLPSFDILEQVFMQLGYRLSLNRLAEHTLGIKKSADGLQALTWYRQGE